MFDEIIGSKNWKIIRAIDEGWSEDKKYYIETTIGEEFLLRISDIALYDKKKKDYRDLNKLKDMDIRISTPIQFGICNNDTKVYILFTWIKGSEAIKKLPMLSEEKQYNLGFEAGKTLKKIHDILSEDNLESWSHIYNKKIDRNIENYYKCGLSIEGMEHIIRYIEDNRYLLDERNQCLQHGDFHVGNMIVTNDNELGIIDFNRMNYGDPWEEFNRITWCANTSHEFAKGRINGYFDNNVPEKFFKLMTLYIGCNQLGSIPWSLGFGQKEVDTITKQCEMTLNYYDDFKSFIPKWYTSEK